MVKKLMLTDINILQDKKDTSTEQYTTLYRTEQKAGKTSFTI